MNKVKLIDFVNDKYTDKNTRHSYIEVYDKLFQPLRYKAENILEIGIRKGGSIKMLHDYFEKATITAIDNKDDFPITFLRNLDRVHLHFQDAYNIDTLTYLSMFIICFACITFSTAFNYKNWSVYYSSKSLILHFSKDLFYNFGIKRGS